MTTHKVTLETPMIRMTFGWGADFILPWEDGVQLLAVLRGATFIETEHRDGRTQYYKKPKADLNVTLFNPEEQANLLMNGVKEIIA